MTRMGVMCDKMTIDDFFSTINRNSEHFKYNDEWKILSLTMQLMNFSTIKNSEHCEYSDESTQCSHKLLIQWGAKCLEQ